MKRPRITQNVIEGILNATCFLLAGDLQDETRRDINAVQRADQWARQMRSWMRERGTWKETAE